MKDRRKPAAKPTPPAPETVRKAVHAQAVAQSRAITAPDPPPTPAIPPGVTPVWIMNWPEGLVPTRRTGPPPSV